MFCSTAKPVFKTSISADFPGEVEDSAKTSEVFLWTGLRSRRSELQSIQPLLRGD